MLGSNHEAKNGGAYAEEMGAILRHFSEDELERILRSTHDKGIRLYYLLNRYFYKRYVSRDGYMHYPLDGDILYQVKRIEEHLRDGGATGKKVLELGAGNGVNSDWLARHNPDAYFLATDISNPGLKQRASNNDHLLTDYHRLDHVPEGAFDIAFAIETLCYSTQKPNAFRSIASKLKPGGKLIVFDGYSRESEDTSEEERYVRDLWAAGMAVDELATLSWFKQAATGTGMFELTEIADLSDLALDFSDYLTSNAHRFFNDQRLKVRFARRFTPLTIRKNVITALLNSAIFRNGLCYYYMHVFTRR